MVGRCVGSDSARPPMARGSARPSPPICWHAAARGSSLSPEGRTMPDSAALRGRRIVVTRTGEAGLDFAARLHALGAEPILAPTIAILPPDDFGPLDAAIAALGSYDGLVFTSAN